MRQIISPLDGFRSPFGRLMGSTAPFTPAVLFGASEPGVWYDPSDLTTLFQDTAGTLPVTTPGQTVGLALDKSKGLVLGSEQIVNGSFGADTNWTKINGATISGGVANLFNAATTPAITQTRGFTLGRTYKVSLTWTGTISAGIGAFGSGDIRFLTSSTLGSWTGYVTLSAGTGADFWVSAPANVASTVDNISVKELPGFHATQATLASRPTYGIVPLGGRRNLLTRTEEFNDAAWTKTNATVTANAGTAPDGTTTADKIIATAVSSNHFAQQSFVMGAAPHTVSCYMKAAEYTTGSIFLSQSGNNGAVFTLSGSGSAVASGTGNTASIVSVGDGWYRCSVTNNGSADIFDAIRVGPADGAIAIYTGNGTDGILIWGAQLELGSTATAYQRVGSAFDVTEAGVASLPYLSFDGVDDFLITPTITPGIDKAQVFAGVRKLSDNSGVIVEHSATTANNGTLLLQNSNGGSPLANYAYRSRGTITADAVSANTFAAPLTNVLTGLGDISGDRSTIRINGTQVAQNTNDQGTGNYLDYPMYIGRRGGTTIPFNGFLFGLIVRFGTNLDAGTITSTETWVGGKTGVTL